MNKFLNSSWFYRILSLILACLLFIYVNQSKLSFVNSHAVHDLRIARLGSTEEKTISMPVQVEVNGDKYIVTGCPQRVKVHLSGPAALVNTTVNTHNFRTYVNLSHFGPGYHRAQISTSGLNSEIHSRIESRFVRVRMQGRKVRTFPVKVNYNKKGLDSGYHAKAPVEAFKKVQVSGTSQSIERIKQVVAQLNIPKGTWHSIHARAIMEALDSHGRTVNVVISPSTNKIKISIHKNS